MRLDSSEDRGGVATKHIEDLEVTGQSGRDYWSYGIHAFDVTFVTINNYTYRSKVGKGIGIKFSGGSSNPQIGYNSEFHSYSWVANTALRLKEPQRGFILTNVPWIAWETVSIGTPLSPSYYYVLRDLTLIFSR